MSQTVKVKRSNTADAVPSSLSVGELAANMEDMRLWIGTPSGVKEFGMNDSSALTDADIGVSVQAYDADLTSWAGIVPSAKQDTLVSGTNIKTVNNQSLLGSGNLTIEGSGSVTLVFPFYKAAGSSDTIALIGGTSLPFYDSSNTSKNIALIGG